MNLADNSKKNRILFPFRFKNLEAVLSNPQENPKEFMYGAYGLLKEGRQIDYFLEPRGKRDSLFKKFLYFFEKPVTLSIKLGMPHEIYLCHKEEYKIASKVVCINDAISLAVLFWKWMGKIDADVYTLFQSLPERHLKYFKNKTFRVRLISRLLSHATQIMVLSSSAKYEMAKTFHIPLNRISVFYFGVDLDFWEPKLFEMEERKYILSVGNDMNRDYQTLLKALDNQYEVIFVTKLPIKNRSAIVKNDITNSELRELYQKARIVVIPSVKLLTESSGLSTALQAMSCGVPVLLSDSLPMRELFTEDEHVFYYEPENPESLRSKLDSVWNDKRALEKVSSNGRSLIRERYNSNNMTEQLRSILDLTFF